jgi:N-acetylglucosaminyldiphosphoundecaprenol N-acetyl-beta-D-mannosaminyltransferase
MPRIQLGPISAALIDGTLIKSTISDRIHRHLPSQAITFNSLMFNEALRDPEFARVISNAALSVADSAGICWALHILTGRKYTRLPGIDLVPLLCEWAVEQHFSLYFMGAEPGIAEAAAKKLSEAYPGLRIVGSRHGYFTDEEEPALIQSIREQAPDILLVGLGVPRQEKWIASHLNELGVPLVMGVGGSFDVISGNLKRAPVWMRKTGLEWLYRLLQQPWRIGRILALLLFVLNVLKLKYHYTASRAPARRS